MNNPSSNRSQRADTHPDQIEHRTIGNLEFNYVGHCLYHLSVHVFLTTELPFLLCDAEWHASLTESLDKVAESQTMQAQ